MDDVIADYLHYLQIERGLTANTISSYHQDLKSFSAYLNDQHLTLSQVEQLTILNYLNTLREAGKSRRTVTRAVSTLRRFFQYLVQNDQLPADPMAEIKAPKQGQHLRKCSQSKRSMPYWPHRIPVISTAFGTGQFWK